MSPRIYRIIKLIGGGGIKIHLVSRSETGLPFRPLRLDGAYLRLGAAVGPLLARARPAHPAVEGFTIDSMNINDPAGASVRKTKCPRNYLSGLENRLGKCFYIFLCKYVRTYIYILVVYIGVCIGMHMCIDVCMRIC